MKVTSYNMSFNANDYACILLANAPKAMQHNYGHDLCKVLCQLHQQYQYNSLDTDTTLLDIIQHLNAADSDHDPADVRASKATNTVNETINALTHLLQDVDISHDYNASALVVSGSDSKLFKCTKCSTYSNKLKPGNKRGDSPDRRKCSKLCELLPH
jgi:hypothetical protein